jgi:hypothetical protein
MIYKLFGLVLPDVTALELSASGVAMTGGS